MKVKFENVKEEVYEKVESVIDALEKKEKKKYFEEEGARDVIDTSLVYSYKMQVCREDMKIRDVSVTYNRHTKELEVDISELRDADEEEYEYFSELISSLM